MLVVCDRNLQVKLTKQAKIPVPSDWNFAFAGFIDSLGVAFATLFYYWEDIMRELQFVVEQAYHQMQLKIYLRTVCGVSSSILKKLKWVRDGITVNGVHAYVTVLLQVGDIVLLRLPLEELVIEPSPLPLSVLYEDDDLWILDKPPAMPVHPSPGHDNDSVANGLAYYCLQRNLPITFHPIYRLDKDTSGLLVIAKHSYAASRLAFAVTKRYYGICHGSLSEEQTIDAPIRLLEGHGIQREVGEGETAQRAVTHIKALKALPDATLLELHLETGRTHQIRVHLSSIGHPLVGDDLYGGSRHRIQRQALHCGWVRFMHPVTGQLMEFSAPLPTDMEQLGKESI